MSRPAVALAACGRYEDDALVRAIAAVLDSLTGWRELFDGDPVVLLKPNMLGPKAAETAVTTHPRFVAAVARALRTVHGGRLLVGDGPAISSTTGVARKLGLPALLAPLDVELVDFTETVSVAGGRGFGPMDLARPLVEADRVVNLPRVKTHGQMGLTLAVKNLFGAYVGLEKPRLHLTAGRDYDTFARMLLETAARVDADLHLADGVIGMEGNGPGGGDPRLLGLVAGSRDPVALDRVLAEVLGFATPSLPVQRVAQAEGLPGSRLAGIDLRGDPLDGFRVDDWVPARTMGAEQIFIPKLLARPLRHQLTTRPAFDHRACSRCGLCIEHCAADALQLLPRGRRHPGPKASDVAIDLDLDRCIRCYCCQEVCPDRAISVGEGVLLRLSRRVRTGSRGRR